MIKYIPVVDLAKKHNLTRDKMILIIKNMDIKCKKVLFMRNTYSRLILSVSIKDAQNINSYFKKIELCSDNEYTLLEVSQKLKCPYAKTIRIKNKFNIKLRKSVFFNKSVYIANDADIELFRSKLNLIGSYKQNKENKLSSIKVIKNYKNSPHFDFFSSNFMKV